jgi:nitrogen fixation protein NifU and related proteins
MTNNLNDLYRDILMDHYKYPRGKKSIDNPDLQNQGQNPLCGDSLTVQVKVNENVIDDIGISCTGCAICAASGSMLADILVGKSIDEVKKIARAVKQLIKGEELTEDVDLGDLEALDGIKKYPVRIKCALLSWTTLINSIDAWESGRKLETASTE